MNNLYFLRNPATFALTALVGLFSVHAHAATSTTTFSVDATVSDSCSVSATQLDFGAIDPLDNANNDTDATSTVDVTCSNGTSYDVGLDTGSGGDGTITGRAMDDGNGNTLNYGLYTDTERTTNWDDAGGTNTVTGTGDGTALSHTVYGRVPSGQENTPVGTYTDTITVTVTY